MRASAVLALVLAACGQAPQPPVASAPAGAWQEFEGTWNGAGTRRTLALGDGRRATLLDLKGTLLLAGPGRPGVGFRGETLAFTDSATGLVGRSVWTDERGDQVFSELKGEGTAAKNRITGTFIGGTGYLSRWRCSCSVCGKRCRIWAVCLLVGWRIASSAREPQRLWERLCWSAPTVV